MTVTEDAKEALDQGREKLAGNGNGDLGKKLLVPAAAGLGTLAATYAARKAPELLRDHLKPRLEDKGADEVASVGKRAAEQLKGRKTLSRRWLSSCSARAMTSLPVPDSPNTSTVASESLSRSMRAKQSRMAKLVEMSLGKRPLACGILTALKGLARRASARKSII